MDDTKKGSVSGDTIIKSKYNFNFYSRFNVNQLRALIEIAKVNSENQVKPKTQTILAYIWEAHI